MNRTFTLLFTTVISFGTILVLAGCPGGTKPPATPTPTPVPASTPVSTPATTPISTNLPELVYIDPSGVKHPALLGAWLEIDRSMRGINGFTNFSVEPFDLFVRDREGILDGRAQIKATLSYQQFRHRAPAGPTGPEKDAMLRTLPIYQVEVGAPLRFAGYTDNLTGGGEPLLTHTAFFQLDATQARTVGMEAEVVGDCEKGAAVTKPGGTSIKLPITRVLRAAPGLPHGQGVCTLRLRLCALPGPLENKENSCK
jgi:hypothetical protein